MQPKKKNIFSMYRVLFLAVTLPLIVVLINVTNVSTRATSREIKNLAKNYMLSTVKQCGRNIDSAIFKGTDQTLSYDTLAAEAPAYTITDVASSYLYIVDGHTAEMLYHPTKEKVGKAVENEAVKTLLSQIKEGKHPESDIIEYEFNGTLNAVILINYIHLQASVISHINEITRLETELNTLKRSNDEKKNRLESNIDLEYIRQIAIGELGMVYANEDQIILYKTQKHDSMRKNTD